MDDELNTNGKESGDALLKTVLKAVAVMECFSTLDRKLSIAEIAKRLKMPRGTAHRLVATLKEVGFVEQERERDEYKLGIKLFELGNIVLSNMDLHREAKTFVEALTDVTGEAVHLCVFDGIQTTVIHRTESSSERTNTVVVMEASPAHCTSTGKAALAFQPEAVVERVIKLGLRSFTQKTITDPQKLREELALIRKRGYAVDDEELSPGIRCVGAPIRNLSGKVFASISVSGPARRVTEAKVPALGELVMHYAAGISARLGYRPPAEHENERESVSG